MAWNEPGGGRDPWGGNNNNNDGPPDLDEALQKMRERFNSVFGGKGGGKGNGGLFTVIAVIALALWGFLGIYQLDAKERAVIQRLGEYHDTAAPGLHWNPPLIDTVTVVNVTEERSYTSRGLMLTQDESIVEVPVTVQYKVDDPKAFVLNVRDPEISLRHATDSAIRHVVGSTSSSDVLSEGRAALAGETKSRLQQYLSNYTTGIIITQVNILKAEPPAEVKAAFDDVIAAKENKDQYKNEAETYYNGVIPEARGTAQRLIQEATAYRDQVIAEAQGEAERFNKLLVEYKKAPEVTRQRLYLDAVQHVMGNASKVLVDVEGGNNMLYLPLDKIAQPQKSTTSISAYGAPSEGQVRQLVEEALQDILREQNSGRRRESRR